jgi:hypothetical protein
LVRTFDVVDHEVGIDILVRGEVELAGTTRAIGLLAARLTSGLTPDAFDARQN